ERPHQLDDRLRAERVADLRPGDRDLRDPLRGLVADVLEVTAGVDPLGARALDGRRRIRLGVAHQASSGVSFRVPVLVVATVQSIFQTATSGSTSFSGPVTTTSPVPARGPVFLIFTLIAEALQSLTFPLRLTTFFANGSLPGIRVTVRR